MPPRELTLVGVPTIATQWLGMWDIDRWGIPLKVKAMCPCTFDDYQANAVDALWSEPDIDDLIRQMHWVIDHYSQAKEIALGGRSYLLEHFRWHTIGQRLQAIIKEYA